MWTTKEWCPLDCISLIIFKPSLFGFSFLLNIYQFDVQIGFFGLNVNFSSIRKWIVTKFKGEKL